VWHVHSIYVVSYIYIYIYIYIYFSSYSFPGYAATRTIPSNIHPSNHLWVSIYRKRERKIESKYLLERVFFFFSKYCEYKRFILKLFPDIIYAKVPTQIYYIQEVVIYTDMILYKNFDPFLILWLKHFLAHYSVYIHCTRKQFYTVDNRTSLALYIYTHILYNLFIYY
jgi:hypothetical protein